MRINQVVLVPRLLPGKGEGQLAGKFSEREAIETYTDAACEHMEEDRVIVKIHDGQDLILPHTLIIGCDIGWEKPNSKAKSNMATVGYMGQEAFSLATMFCESLSEWGKSYADYHHKTANPRPESDYLSFDTPDTIGVVLRPFKLNGVEAESYMRNLDALGRTIAYCVNEFLLNRDGQGKIF